MFVFEKLIFTLLIVQLKEALRDKENEKNSRQKEKEDFEKKLHMEREDCEKKLLEEKEDYEKKLQKNEEELNKMLENGKLAHRYAKFLCSLLKVGEGQEDLGRHEKEPS